MAGPLGANDPGNILQAALIAAGFGGAAASIFEKEEVEEGEINENIGNDINNFINSFEFSQEGNDELIDFANRLLDGDFRSEDITKLKSFVDELEFLKLVSDPNRGMKSIAQQIYKRLKQGTASGGGIETFSSNPKALQALISKLPSDSLQEGELARGEEYKIVQDGEYFILTYINRGRQGNPEVTEKFKTKEEAEKEYKEHLEVVARINKQFADGEASGDPRYQQPF